jgi:hypothetical protein
MATVLTKLVAFDCRRTITMHLKEQFMQQRNTDSKHQHVFLVKTLLSISISLQTAFRLPPAYSSISLNKKKLQEAASYRQLYHSSDTACLLQVMHHKPIITITILAIIHRPVFYLKLNSTL